MYCKRVLCANLMWTTTLHLWFVLFLYKEPRNQIHCIRLFLVVCWVLAVVFVVVGNNLLSLFSAFENANGKSKMSFLNRGSRIVAIANGVTCSTFLNRLSMSSHFCWTLSIIYIFNRQLIAGITLLPVK